MPIDIDLNRGTINHSFDDYMSESPNDESLDIQIPREYLETGEINERYLVETQTELTSLLDSTTIDGNVSCDGFNNNIFNNEVSTDIYFPKVHLSNTIITQMVKNKIPLYDIKCDTNIKDNINFLIEKK